MLVLLSQRAAVASLVVAALHTVEEVADVHDPRAALLRLEEMLHLEVAVAGHRVMVRVGSEEEMGAFRDALHPYVGDDDVRRRTRRLDLHADTLSEMMIST